MVDDFHSYVILSLRSLFDEEGRIEENERHDLDMLMSGGQFMRLTSKKASNSRMVENVNAFFIQSEHVVTRVQLVRSSLPQPV